MFHSSAALLFAMAATGQIALLLLASVGAIAIAQALYFYLTDKEGRFGPKVGFAPDRGTPILDYVNEDVLRDIASHHKVEGPPAKVERQRKRGIRGGPNSLRASSESNTTETTEPHDNLAELTQRLLAHLLKKKKGAISQAADCVHIDQIEEPPPYFMREKEACNFFETWLAENFPNGLEGVADHVLAKRLAQIGHQVPDGKLRALVTDGFKHLQDGPERLLFLGGEWTIDEDENGVLLTKTDLRVEMGNGDIGAHSLPMPAGISITSHLALDGLTVHGRTRMLGVTQPIRTHILGTRRQYKASEGSFEVAPIAAFQNLVDEDGD